jgi:hypothetical protein
MDFGCVNFTLITFNVHLPPLFSYNRGVAIWEVSAESKSRRQSSVTDPSLGTPMLLSTFRLSSTHRMNSCPFMCVYPRAGAMMKRGSLASPRAMDLARKFIQEARD